MTPTLVVDLVLAVLGLEAILLALVARGGRRPSFAALLPNLAAGVFLVLAVRAAVLGLGAPWIGVFLALGGAAHVVDLRVRFRAR